MKNSLIVFFVLMAFQSVGQKKMLSLTAIKSVADSGIINPLPRPVGWLNENEFLFVKAKPGSRPDSVVMNVTTGTTTAHRATPKKTLRIVDGDIFYYDGLGGSKQLTKTVAVEKNATFSPDSSKIAYTRNNDLYYTDLKTWVETRLTFDGSDVIYNGYASWVYYEEILGRASNYKAFWWSPDSKQIAFMRFDDRKVPVFPLYNDKGTHGFTELTRYPKAGDPNPTVTIAIANLATAKIKLANFDASKDQYFGTPFFSPDSKTLYQQWMNRGQDSLVLFAVDVVSGNILPHYTEVQQTWVEWIDNLYFTNNGKQAFFLSDKSGWNHIYQLDMVTGKEKQITQGEWAVRSIDKVDEQNNTIFFTARKEHSTRLDLYAVSFDGNRLKRLTFGSYTHRTFIGPDGKKFMDVYSNVATPDQIAVVDVVSGKQKNLFDAKGSRFNEFALAETKLLSVRTSDGFALPLTITLPIRMEASKKYPVLINIYGGPNAGTVMDGWKDLMQTQAWASEGLIQVAMDHRASGHYGKMGQNFVHRNLGEYEIKDYTEIVKWLIQQPYVDKDKIAINGFSYGGYLTALALAKAPEYFKYGIAGGSVTDWRLYDSHYTERYMDSPDENKVGYDKSSVLNYVNNYEGGLYIVHGTMDDNVHMQQSLQLAAVLQDAKKEFKLMFYPDARHGWRNLPDRWKHFNNEKTRFYYEYLLGRKTPKEMLE